MSASSDTQFGFNFDPEPTGQEIVRRAFEEVTQEELREIGSEIGVELAEPEEEVADPPAEVQTHLEAERNGQIPLLNIGEWWEEHWKGMPEFVQKDQAPWKTVYVHFENREDMEKFSALVGQKVGLNTRSIWYPEAEIGRFAGKRYIDAEPEREVEGVETFEDEE